MSDTNTSAMNDQEVAHKKIKDKKSSSRGSGNFSKTIDESFKKTKKEEKGSKPFLSIDLDRCADKSSTSLLLNSPQVTNNTPQRSIDYPLSIVRKTPKLSDIVRKRLLFQKVSRGITLLGESFSSSVEREHIPKAPRKIIIRQDNSIEIDLAKPPKLRLQASSVDVGSINICETPTSLSNTLSANAQMSKNPSMLSVSSNGNDRRKTIEMCEDIFRVSEETTKLRAKTPPSNPHRILLCKDKSDKFVRSKSCFFYLAGFY